MVLSAHFANGAQLKAVGAFGTGEVSEFALEFEATGFAGGRVLVRFRKDPKILSWVSCAGEGGVW
jgi:hypothetical protein